MSSVVLPPRLARQLQGQSGVVARWQAKKLDVTDAQLREAVSAGALVRVRHGVYALPPRSAAEDDAAAALAQARRSATAAALSLRAELCSVTAAQWWGMPLVHEPTAVHLRRDRRRPGHEPAPQEGLSVVVHEYAVPPSARRLVDNVVVLSPARTATDLARDLPLGEAVAALDGALRRGLVRRRDVESELVRMAPGPGRRAATRALRLADARAESVFESLTRVHLVEAGLAPEVLQLTVRADGLFLGRWDMAWPSRKLLLECDGWVYHSGRPAWLRDLRRRNAVVRRGWRVLQATWEDVVYGAGDRLVGDVAGGLAAVPRAA